MTRASLTEPASVVSTDPGYPAALARYLGSRAPARLFVLGDPSILQTRPLALFCSRKCPGNLIVQTYELAQKWREAGLTVIGGFHSPMERQCLSILLRSPHPVILCPARGLPSRIEAQFRRPLAEGRLLILSAFAETDRRGTEETAYLRNGVVAALADRIFVAHAETASRTESFVREIAAWAKPLFTLECESNRNLTALGARPFPTQSTPSERTAAPCAGC